MTVLRIPAERAARLAALSAEPTDAQIRRAAWVARCVGRGKSAPFQKEDVTALAATLAVRSFPPGGVLFRVGDSHKESGSPTTARSSCR